MNEEIKQLFHSLQEKCKYYKVDNTGKILVSRNIKITNLIFNESGNINICYVFKESSPSSLPKNTANIDVAIETYDTYLIGIFTSEKNARNAGLRLTYDNLQFKIMCIQSEIDVLLQKKQALLSELDALNKN